jgi:hypothetical protein
LRSGEIPSAFLIMSRKIVISVGIAAQPVAAAGNMWYSLNWVLGFREAGWDVWMVESIAADRCIDTAWHSTPIEQSANLAAWNQIVAQFGLEGRATLLVDQSAPDLEALRAFAAEAEVFLNLSGHFRQGVVTFPRACRVYLDADPAFTQVWADQYQCDMNFADHDRYVSVGQRMGQVGTFAPTCGIDWIPTFPPVVLKYWPFAPQTTFGRFTTVAHWEGYKSSEWCGQWFHGKSEQFQTVVDLPRSVSRPLEVATQIEAHSEELEPYRQGGWQFTDASEVCGDLMRYERYLRESSAEFSVAKGGYVLSKTGWFSDRSVCYAALGRPLVLEDTGVGDLLPSDSGVYFFRSAAEAAEACERVIADYANQQSLVRRVAEETFASHVVIGRLLARLGVG